jgi:hypothetical protein
MAELLSHILNKSCVVPSLKGLELLEFLTVEIKEVQQIIFSGRLIFEILL